MPLTYSSPPKVFFQPIYLYSYLLHHKTKEQRRHHKTKEQRRHIERSRTKRYITYNYKLLRQLKKISHINE